MLRNSSGSEHGPIVLVDIKKQITKIVLQDIDAQSGMVVWAADGSRFLFRSNIENKRDYKIYEYCLNTYSYILKIDCEGWGYPLQYSPCGAYLLYGVASSGANQDVYLYDISLGSSRHLTLMRERFDTKPLFWGIIQKFYFYQIQIQIQDLSVCI